MNQDELASKMAEAVKGRYPRYRISQLEPVEAVAHGIMALYDAGVEELEAAGYGFNHLQKRTMLERHIAECLRTWQAETVEAAMERWLLEPGSITVASISGDTRQVRLTRAKRDPLRFYWRDWFGSGTLAAALGEALKNYDEDQGEERE